MPRAPSLLWRALLGSLVGLLGAVPALLVGMNLLRPFLTVRPGLGPYALFFRSLARFAVFTGSAAAGLLLGLSIVVVLHAQARRGRPSLRRAVGRSLRRTPSTLAAAAAELAHVALALVGFPVVVAAAAVRAGVWERRRRAAGADDDLEVIASSRRAAVRDLVPLAVFVRAVAQLVLVLPSGLLQPGSPLVVVRRARHHARGRTRSSLGHVAAPLLVNGGLTLAALPRLERVVNGNPTGSIETLLATGVLLAVTALTTTVLGLGLGALAATSGIASGPLDPPAAGEARTPRRMAGRVRVWRPATAAAVALVLCVSLLSVSLDPIPAYAVTAAATADIVVDTLSDTATPDPAECQSGAPCSLRGALALAGSLALPLTIGFSVAGTIDTVDTLQVPDGATIHGGDGIVLAGGGTHGVLRVNAGDGGRATLEHLRVVDGRSPTAGAGLDGGAAAITLDHVQFSGNVSGTAGDTGIDGGAVAASYTTVNVTSSTFDHNVALSGRGGAVSAGRLQWTNSTSFADTGLPGEPVGGAVHARFGGTVLHGTFIAGGGVAGDEFSPITVLNSISDPDHTIGAFPCQYVTGAMDAVPSVGNVDVSGMCGGLTAAPGPTGPLADNGGPIQTVALLPGAGGLGAGDAVSCAPVDQRGMARAADSCDAGAYQLSAGDAKATVTIRGNGGDSTAAYVMASVTVPAGNSPQGTLQLLADAAPAGDPVALTIDADGVSGHGSVTADLAAGRHVLTVRFDPTSPAVATAISPPLEYFARVDGAVDVSSPAPTLVGGPADLVVHVHAPLGVTAVPTGDVVLTNGADTHVVTLVDGAASWSVPILQRGTISAEYHGDDAFRAVTTPSVVVTGDHPSETVLQLSSLVPPLGTSVNGTVTVAGGGVGAYGRVVLAVDGVDHAGADLVAGTAAVTLDTSSLSVGAHTATLRYLGEPGWAPSASSVGFDVEPAALAVTVSVAPTAITWGDHATASVTVAATRDGQLVLELLGGGAVLATTQAAALGGGATASFDLTRIVTPSTGPLTVRARGDANFGSSTSEPVTLNVAAAETVTTMSTPSFVRTPPKAGAPMTLRVAVVPLTATTVDVAGTVDVFLDGVHAGTFGVTSQSTDVTVTPPVGGEVGVRIAFTPTGPNPALQPSTSTTTAVWVYANTTSPPAVAWSGPLHPGGAARLDVTFPADGRPAPTGTVEIVDFMGVSYGADALLAGVASVPFFGHATTYSWLALRYPGDASHAPATFTVPTVTITPHPSSTVLSGAPGTVARDQKVDLTVEVAGIPFDTPGRVALIDGADEIASSPIASDGTAVLAFSSSQLREHVLSARFVPDNRVDVAGSDSATSSVMVVDRPAPTLTLARATQTPITAGDPFDLVLSAPWGQYGLRAGNTFSIVTAQGPSGRRFLASGVLVNDWAGLTARVTIPGQDAGALSLSAIYDYGDYGQQGLSAPIAVDIAAVPVILQVSTSRYFTYGDFATINVDGYVSSKVAQPTGGLRVRATVDGGAPIDVLLSPTGTPGHAWSGSFLTYPTHAGTIMVTAATAGDGVSAGPGSISSGITILRRATTLVLTDDGPDTIGRAPREIRAHVAPVGGQFFTPPAVSAVGVWAGSVRASCDASGACLLPEYAVPVGDSTVTGSYPGDDADFLPSGGSVEIHAGARRSDLSYTLDPPNPFAWQSGQQVTVTWTVTTTGAPARGRAVFGIGPSSCEGPALAGSCVVAVPAWDGEGPMPAWDFTREYRPSDDAPAIRNVLPLAPRSCVRVTVARGIVTPASNCSTGAGPGYLTGTDVEVVPDLPTGWHVDSWSINGGLVADSRDGTSDPAMPAAYDFFRFRVTGNAAAAYTYRWTPVCVTLRLAADPYRDWSPEAVGGRTYVITRPNCASPSSPTALELADAARGYYRFAQGTEVELLAYPLNPYGNDAAQIVDRPAFALDTWVNAVADRVVPRLARLTITDDTNAGAVFKVAHCVPTNVLASEGGTVSIRETIRPASSQFLRPVTGACTDQAGRPGFVPGTTAVMDVRPANDGSDRPPAERSQYFFETVSTGTSAPAASAHGDLGPADRYHPLQAEATIPAAFGRTVGLAGQFGHVACVPLTTRLELPADADVPSVGYSDAPNCRAKPTTTAVEYMEGSFAARIQTAWFVEGSQASVAIDAPRVSVRYPTRTVDPNLFLGDWAGLAQARGDERGSEDVLEPVWGVARPGHPAAPTDDISRSQLLDQGADPVLLGRWMSKLCRSLGVYAPTGGSVRVAPATPQCRSGYAPAYVTSLELYVEGGPTDRLLTPWFSVSGSDEDKGAFLGEQTETGNGGRLYTKGSPDSRTDFSTYNASKVMLEFCAEIDYSVRVQDAAGNIAPLDTEKLPLGAVVETDGGCPKGWARPGRTVTVGLTEPANYAFEVIGPEFHKAATLTVDAAGNASRHVDYLLRPFCYRLSVGSRVDIRTPADCPGGDGMQYLRGDVVQLDVNVDPGETFEGWTNVTSSDGNTAFVAMTQDMATGTTIDYPTDLEKFGAAVSSTVQRVVGLVATIGTGLLLAQMAALTVATVAMRAASALAGALGASDAVVHAIDAQAEYMAAQVRIVNALATCTSRWAAGGSGTLVPGGEAGAGIAAANAVAVNRASNVLQNSAGYSAEGAGAVTVALNPVSWVNAFGSHAENYLQDPAEAWSSIGDIGTCMQAEFEASQVSMGIRPAP